MESREENQDELQKGAGTEDKQVGEEDQWKMETGLSRSL